MREITSSRADVQHAGQQNAPAAARDQGTEAPLRDVDPAPFCDSGAEAPRRHDRDERGRVRDGNQLARKYPKPALDDPHVQQELAHRRDEIVEQRGGRDHLSPMQIGDIERYALLEMFVSSWEHYFMKSSPISRQGRVRSGYREGYLSSLDRLMKLGAQIGVERVKREVIQSPTEWLNSLDEHEQLVEREDAHAPDTNDEQTETDRQTEQAAADVRLVSRTTISARDIK